MSSPTILRFHRDVQRRKTCEVAPRFTPLCVEWLEPRTLLAVTPELLTDINTAFAGIVVRDAVVAVGSTAYFAGGDPASVQGSELWRSDGTQAGTELVKDIHPAGSASPKNLTNVNGVLFFVANNGTSGDELWKSDGTAAGTVLVKDIRVGSASAFEGYAIELANINGTFYFRANDGTSGIELWKSDGTAAGTVQVADIVAGAAGSEPRNLTELGGQLLFSGLGASGRELWKSDGTAAGTVLVKDIQPGEGASFPSSLTLVGGTLFFTARDASGEELWKTDGTTEGTSRVKDVHPGPDSSIAGSMENVNGKLFFQAQDRLWMSDGTESGTVLVVPPQSPPRFPTQLTNVNGTLYFVAGVGELWKTDGTQAGTAKLQTNGSFPTVVSDLTNVNGKLMYMVRGNIGHNLYMSDGTPEGTVLVHSIITPSIANSFAPSGNGLVNVNGRLFFRNFSYGIDYWQGHKLWTSDGTAGGTKLIAPAVNPATASSDPANLIRLNDGFLFTATSIETGLELWKTDGTAAGTILVKDIRPGPQGSAIVPSSLINVNGTVFFRISDPNLGDELWSSDGTAAGTILLKDQIGDDALDVLLDVNGTVFFSGFDPVHGEELWKTDGTVAGTTLVKDIYPDVFSSEPEWLFNFNGTLFFEAFDPVRGRELWKSDGTEEGTVFVYETLPGVGSTGARFLGVISGSLIFSKSYFDAESDTNVHELWKTDGTTAGTLLIEEVGRGKSQDTSQAGVGLLTTANGALFFSVSESVHGTEVWKTDGTAAGTFLVKDILPGSGSSSPAYFTQVNGMLYFRAMGGAGVDQLWKTDGTSDGTVLVKEFTVTGNAGLRGLRELTNVNGTLFFRVMSDSAGSLWKSDGTTVGTALIRSGSSTLGSLQNINGVLFFSDIDPAYGWELWSSNGTAAGTFRITDINLGALHSFRGFRTLGDRLLLIAQDEAHGRELWTMKYDPWHNFANQLNVDGSTEANNISISPIDAVLVINYLNAHAGGGAVPVGAPIGPPYLDVDGDNFVSPIDAVLVINWLNGNPAQATAGGGGEGEAAVGILSDSRTVNSTHVRLNAIRNDLLTLLALDLAEQTGVRRRRR